MRLVLCGLTVAGLLTSQLANAACVSQADREALDVTGLKTQLMVQTLTCKNDAEYNAFINKFKPDIVADERTTNTYFSRRYGRSSQVQHDRYLTQLANAKADVSQQDGTRFCAHNEDIFKEVLALKNGVELKEYAAGRTTGMPEVLSTCGGTATAASTSARRPAVHHTARRRG